MPAHDQETSDLQRQMIEAQLNLLQERVNVQKAHSLSPPTRFARGFNAGLSQLLGSPGDLANFFVRSQQSIDTPDRLRMETPASVSDGFAGSEDIQNFAAGLELTPRAGFTEFRSGAAGEMTGATMAIMAPLLRWGQKIAALPAIKKQTLNIGQSLASDMALAAGATPKAFMTMELASAVAAGVGGFEMANRFPDSSGARAMGEVLGGLTPAGAAFLASKAPSAIAATSALLLGEPTTGLLSAAAIRFIRSQTTRGGRARAQARVTRAIDPEVAMRALSESQGNLLQSAPLSVAQRIGDKNLLALERSVMSQTEELSALHQQRFSEVNEAIIESLLSPGMGQAVSSQQTKDYFGFLLDMRMSQAVAKADEAVLALGSGATREEVNILARRELNSALEDARKQETELFNLVPGTAEVSTYNSREAYSKLVIDTPRALREDIPSVAKEFLSPNGENYLGDVTNVKELRGLQSKLREEARIARSRGQWNKARIADDLANEIDNDYSLSMGDEESVQAIENAVTFSKQIKERFYEGEVGTLLGGRTGQPIADQLTLERAIANRGEASAEASDALLRAVNLPEARTDAEMAGYIEDFLVHMFKREAVSEGSVQVQRANNFIRKNERILSRYPRVRQLFREAINGGTEVLNANRFASPKESRAAVFAQAPLGKELDRIIQTADPEAAMEELVFLARQDPEGLAFDGLKMAWLRRLWSKSRVSELDKQDRQFISGRRMTRELEDEAVLASGRPLFTPAEWDRIMKIRDTAIALDGARKSGASTEGVIGDVPGQITMLLSQVGAAQLARKIAGIFGGGTVQTPGLAVSHARRLMTSGIRDPARRLLTDAILDEGTFRALFTPMDSPQRVREVRGAMNAWVIAVLAEQYEVENE